MLAELRMEREQIEEAILTLERLARGRGRRRGRPPAWLEGSPAGHCRGGRFPRRIAGAERRGRPAGSGRQSRRLRQAKPDSCANFDNRSMAVAARSETEPRQTWSGSRCFNKAENAFRRLRKASTLSLIFPSICCRSAPAAISRITCLFPIRKRHFSRSILCRIELLQRHRDFQPQSHAVECLTVGNDKADAANRMSGKMRRSRLKSGRIDANSRDEL